MTAPSTFLACLAEENELLLDSFTAQEALELGLKVLDVAREMTSKPVAIHIDNLQHPLFTHFMDGTGTGNWDWVGKKRRVVREFGHSSWGVGLDFREKGLTFATETGLDPDRYRAEGGSIPLHLRDGKCVGSLTISGLEGFEDHAVAVAGLRRWLGR
ncbi:MAG: heme-binding protein [Spirochaetales bacterium]